MRSPMVICLLAGIVVYLISAIWIVVLAFRRNFWLGCVCFVFPIFQLVCVITNWRDSRLAFYVHLGGYALMLGAVAAAYFSGQLHSIHAP